MASYDTEFETSQFHMYLSPFYGCFEGVHDNIMINIYVKSYVICSKCVDNKAHNYAEDNKK